MSTNQPAIPAALQLDGVSVRLGGRAVLTHASLELHYGELLGIIGPNGAGKTTLLRTALGLVPHAAGTVLIDGRPPRRAGRIGYVPQRTDFAWDFPISVEDVVMTGRTGLLRLLRQPGVADWRAVRDALDRVQLSSLRARTVAELSGGQRQRVLLARALALQSRVLLLDEPYTGLDVPTQDALGELFRELADSGLAVAMSTHDLTSTLRGFDRLALVDGTVIAAGTPRELADRDLWARTFGFAPDHPLLTLLDAAR